MIWGLVNFHAYLSLLISREQQSNSSKTERNQLHVRPAARHTRILTKPTSVSVFRRSLHFYRLGCFCSPLHPHPPSTSNLWTVSDLSILNPRCFQFQCDPTMNYIYKSNYIEISINDICSKFYNKKIFILTFCNFLVMHIFQVSSLFLLNLSYVSSSFSTAVSPPLSNI